MSPFAISSDIVFYFKQMDLVHYHYLIGSSEGLVIMPRNCTSQIAAKTIPRYGRVSRYVVVLTHFYDWNMVQLRKNDELRELLQTRYVKTSAFSLYGSLHSFL